MYNPLCFLRRVWLPLSLILVVQAVKESIKGIALVLTNNIILFKWRVLYQADFPMEILTRGTENVFLGPVWIRG